MMKTWTTQTGYPLISVTETSKGNYSISQSRFLLNGKKGQGHWMIPISVSNPKGIHDCGQFSSDTGVSLNEVLFFVRQIFSISLNKNKLVFPFLFRWFLQSRIHGSK